MKKHFTDKVAKKTGRKQKIDSFTDEREAYTKSLQEYHQEKKEQYITELRSEQAELKAWKERKLEPPIYRINSKTRRFETCFMSYMKLFHIKYTYVAKELHINKFLLGEVFRNEKCLKIDKMIKLCHFLMIPTVEDAYNINNRVLHYYCGNVFSPPVAKQNEHLTFAVDYVHRTVINEGMTIKYESEKKTNFVQNLTLNLFEKRLLLTKPFINYKLLWRIINNKRIPRADVAFKMIHLLNTFTSNKEHRISDYWYWE